MGKQSGKAGAGEGGGGSTYERRAWTRKEDDAIIRLVEEYGTKRWSVISDHLNGENHGTERTGKQCRTRYRQADKLVSGCCFWWWRLTWSSRLLFAPVDGSTTWTQPSRRIRGRPRRSASSRTRRRDSVTSGPRSPSCCLAGASGLCLQRCRSPSNRPVGNSLRTDNAIKNHWYSSMRRTMRRMAKQQNKSLVQANSGRQGVTANAATKPGKQLGSPSSMADGSAGSTSDAFGGALDGLSKQASVFKDCYNSMLKQTEPKDREVQAAAMMNAQGPAKKTNSKRKRKDLRICTAGSTGANSMTGDAPTSGGMFLPEDTPRRVLHTQLLLQLLNNSSDDNAHLGKIDAVFLARVGTAGPPKSKKRNVGGKKGVLQAKGLPPLSSSDPTSDLPRHLDGHSFPDMDAFEHLDMDFNAVRSASSFSRRRLDSKRATLTAF
jgi:hypothetical protein